MRADRRNDENAARLRLSAHREHVETVPDELVGLYARRHGRSLAGTVALSGAVVLAVLAAGGMVAYESLDPDHAYELAQRGILSIAFLAVWIVSAAAYGIGRALGPSRLRRALAGEAQESGDVDEGCAGLDAAMLRARMRRLLDAQERRSIARPLAGFLVLAPLSLHGAIRLSERLLSPGTFGAPLGDFDRWICWSLILAGHCHAILAYRAFSFARRIEAMSGREIAAEPPRDGARAFWITSLASLIPGAIVYLVPPILVAATSAIVVLPAFAIARDRLLAERRLLDV